MNARKNYSRSYCIPLLQIVPYNKKPTAKDPNNSK